MEILKVSAKSSPNGVAGAIAGLIKENGKVEVQAIDAYEKPFDEAVLTDERLGIPSEDAAKEP